MNRFIKYHALKTRDSEGIKIKNAFMEKEKSDLFIDKNKITPLSIVFGVFIFAAIISPGYLFFYIYHRDFFIASDWVKLLFLSIGITSPFFLINTFLSTYYFYKNLDELKNLWEGKVFIRSTYSTLILFYISLLISFECFHHSGENFASETFIFVICVTQILLIICSCSCDCLSKIHKYRNKNK